MFEQSRTLIKEHGGLIAAGFLLYFFSAFGQSVMIGVYLPHLQADLALSKTAIGSLYAIATIASSVVIVFTGKGLDHFPLRNFVAAVFAGLAAGCFLLAHAYSVIMLFIAFFMLRHFGQGLPGLSASTSINRYVDHGKGKAVSLATLGGAAHIIIFPLVTLTLEKYFDWRVLWQFYGLFVLLVLLPGFWFFLRAHQTKTHARWEQRVKIESERAAAALETEWTRNHVLKDWRFYGLICITVLAPFVGTAIMFYQRELAAELTLSPLQFASSFPLFTGASVAFSLATGYIIDKYGEKPALIAAPLIFTGGLLLLTSGISLPVIFTGIMFVGGANGMTMTIGGPLLAHLYGTKHLGSIKSLLFSTSILSSALSPFIFGFLNDRGYDITTQLSWVIYYSGVVWLLAFPICSKLKTPQRGTA